MTSVRLCTVAADMGHLVEVPLQQALVRYTLDRDGDRSTILIAETDVDRARTALERFGTFRVGA